MQDVWNRFTGINTHDSQKYHGDKRGEKGKYFYITLIYIWRRLIAGTLCRGWVAGVESKGAVWMGLGMGGG